MWKRPRLACATSALASFPSFLTFSRRAATRCGGFASTLVNVLNGANGMQSRVGVVEPHQLALALEADGYRVNVPRDADETYDRILSVLATQLLGAAQTDWLRGNDLGHAVTGRTPVRRCPPQAPSSGFLERQLSCTQCHQAADTKLETFTRLSVSMPISAASGTTTISSTQVVELSSCLREVSGKEEAVEGVWCSGCSRRTRQSLSFRISRFPQILCIHLKRLRWSTESGTAVRDDRPITMKVRLPISWLIAKDGIAAPRGWEYHLRAVVLHFDKTGRSGGHYTCLRFAPRKEDRGFGDLVRPLHPREDHGKWFYVNDDVVTQASFDRQQGLKNAYMLFYELVSSD